MLRLKILFPAFVLSITVFSLIFFPLISLSDISSVEEPLKPSLSDYLKNQEKCEEISMHMLPTECDEYLAGISKEKDSNEKESNFYFYFICAIIYVSLFVQTYLFMKSIFENVNHRDFYTSEWAINSSPMLGVLGTIVAFSLLMGSSEGANIKDLFSEHFFEAAITTILGGVVYVINLMLGIQINARVSELKS